MVWFLGHVWIFIWGFDILMLLVCIRNLRQLRRMRAQRRQRERDPLPLHIAPEIIRARAAVGDEEAQMALDKSSALLKRIVGTKNFKHLTEHHFIEVPVAFFGAQAVRLYVTGGVAVMKGGRELPMCVHPNVDMPHADIILTYYLLAKHRPRHFLTTGNWDRSYF